MHEAIRKLLALWLCLSLAWLSRASNATTSARVEPLKLSSVTQDLSSSATAKSYEPPPEFYRGPGSASTVSATDSATSGGGFLTKPLINTHLSSVGDSLSETYNKWRNAQDRISVGHYGGSGIQSHGHANSAGYAYEGHPYEYATTHGGSATPYAGGSTSHYPSGTTTHYPGGSSSHYSGSGAYYGSSAETPIPFDVYGSSRPLGGGGHGHYAGAGGEYSYTYPFEGHEVATHKGPQELSQKALLAKSFLIPLASAAVLGIAAALVSNPLLLQLGTVSGVGPTVVGKRKRRSTKMNSSSTHQQRAYRRT